MEAILFTILQIFFTAHAVLKFGEYINNNLSIWRENMLGYLSADIICSKKQTVKRSSRKTASFEEQIMSKDKYANIFSLQMETIVFIILQIFYTMRAVLKIGVHVYLVNKPLQAAGMSADDVCG